MDLFRNNTIIPNENAIFEAVKHCVNDIVAYIASDKPLSRRFATSMKHKLEVWAKYSGATSRQGLSLDDRVAALPSVKNAILALLSLVSMQVKQAFSLPDEEIDIPDDSIQRTENSRLRDSSNQEFRGRHIRFEPWSSIAEAINSLFKLAAAIRDSDNSSDDIETPAHYSRPDDEYFENIAKLFVRRWFPHAKRELSDQIGHGIFVRRRKILYRQRHEEKLQFHRSSILVDQTGAEMIALPGGLSMLFSELPNRRPEQLRAHEGRSHVVAPSLTQFSQFHTQSTIMRRTQAATVVTGRTRGALIHETAGLNYPEVPKTLDPGTPIFCPYCCQRLTQSQLLNWRRHVDADLKPFICMSEICQHPLKFFSLQSDWLQHMDEYHGTDWCQTVHMTTWFCNIEHGEIQEFVKIEDFREHLDTHKLSSLEQDVLIRHNQAIGTRAFGVCPLCEDTPQHEGDLGARVVFDHIANHLRRVALMALPTEATDPELDKDAGGSLQSDKAILPDTLGGTDNLLSRSDDTRHMQEEEGAELPVYPGSTIIPPLSPLLKDEDLLSLAKSTADSSPHRELELRDQGLEDMGLGDLDNLAEQDNRPGSTQSSDDLPLWDYANGRGTNNESAITNHPPAAYPILSDDMTGLGNLLYEKLSSRYIETVRPWNLTIPSDLISELRLLQVSAHKRELECDSTIRKLALMRKDFFQRVR